MNEQSDPTPHNRSTALHPTVAEGLILGLISLAVVAIYGQIGQHRPLAFDDALYLTENGWVLQGLTWRGALWAFTNVDAANWHPLTWLSHMADQSLFGSVIGAHMIENLFWHAANSMLVYRLLRALNLTRTVACVLALIFAAHPLNVESVAWLSQRKTQLSTFFLLVTTLVYLGGRIQQRTSLQVLLVTAFSLSLMAKATGVALPLILLGYEAMRFRQSTAENPRGAGPALRPWLASTLRRLAPLVAVALAVALATFFAQRSQGAVASVESIPLLHRIPNAATAITTYLRTFVWPAELCLFYPMPKSPDWAEATTGLLLLAAGGLWIAVFARRAPLMILGGIWFLLALLPVVGLVQVGSQSHADRYMYLPMIGLLIMIGAFTETVRLPDGRPGRAALTGVLTAFALGMGVHAFAYTQLWRDPETAYRRSIAVGGPSYAILLNLAAAYEQQNLFKTAEQTNAIAARLWPDRPGALGNHASSLALLGRYAEAETLFRRALALDPENFKLHYLLGLVLLESNNPECEVFFQNARRLLPPETDWRPGNLEIRNILVGRAPLPQHR